MRLCLALALVTLLLWLPQSPTITLDPSTTYQTIVGWEATAQAGQSDFPDWNLYKHSLADQAVADGIDRIRLEVSYKTEANAPNLGNSVNDNADPFVINPTGFQWGNANGVNSQVEIANLLRSRLQALGKDLKVNLCFVDFNSADTLHSGSAEDFAELIQATFLHIAPNGWVPDYVEMLLEADKTSNLDWTGSTTTPNGAKIAAALLATRNRLAAHGWFPKFILPSPTDCDKADILYNAIKAANPAIVGYTSEFSFHRYTSTQCSQSQLDQNKAVAAADGLSLSMLERKGATYHTLTTDLKAGVVAWQQYALGYNVALTGDNGENYYLVNHTTHTVTISSRMKFLRQYFKYIRRGAVRIEASSSDLNFDPVAFINPDGQYVVVVNALAGGTFSIGLPSGTYGIRYTTATAYDQSHPNQQVSGTLTTSIPAAGVLTVFGISAAQPTPTPTPVPSPSPSPSPAPVSFKLSCGGQFINGTITNVTCVQIP